MYACEGKLFLHAFRVAHSPSPALRSRNLSKHLLSLICMQHKVCDFTVVPPQIEDVHVKQ